MKKILLLVALCPLLAFATTFEFRELTNADGEHVNQMTAAFINSNPESYIFSPEEDQRYRKQRSKKFSIYSFEFYYGAFLGDKIIGIIFGSIPNHMNMRQKHIMYIHFLFVLPEYRNLGIGTRLLEMFIEEAKSKNITRILFPIIEVNSPEQQKVLSKMNFERSVRSSKWIKEKDGTFRSLDLWFKRI